MRASSGDDGLAWLEREASRCGLVELELHEDGPYGSSARLQVWHVPALRQPVKPACRYRVVWIAAEREQAYWMLDRRAALGLVAADEGSRAAARAACASGAAG